MWTPGSRCSVGACPSVDGLHPSCPASGFASLAPCRGPLKSRAFAYPAAHRPFAAALPGALRAGARAHRRKFGARGNTEPQGLRPALGLRRFAPWARGNTEPHSAFGGSCGRHRGKPPVPPGASSRGLCPPPPSPRAGPAIGAVRSTQEGLRHQQGSTGAPRPGNTCRGSAPAPGPAGRAMQHGTSGGRARNKAMVGHGAAGLDDGGRLELGGQWARWAERQHPGDAPGVGRDNRSRSRGEAGRPP